jgi:hypothetical protein
METAAIVVSIVSLCLMIALYCRTTKFEKSVANRNKHTLEFMANLIINAAYDPDIVRRLILDYRKGMTWRGGVFYSGDKYHSIAWEMPEPEGITIGDLKIAIVRQPIKDDNTPS